MKILTAQTFSIKMSDFVTNNEKASFREIALEHLRKILELSTHEFRGGFYNVISTQSGTERVYVPDARRCYSQAVESFARVLYPHFDNEMEGIFEKYEENNEEVEKFYSDLKTKQLQEKKDEGGLTYDDKVKITEKVRWNYQKQRLALAHKLFTQLNKLLKRTNYLKKAIYSEQDEESD